MRREAEGEEQGASLLLKKKKKRKNTVKKGESEGAEAWEHPQPSWLASESLLWVHILINILNIL